MLHIGLLWYDDDVRHPLPRKVADAVARHEERLGLVPNLCQLNPAQATALAAMPAAAALKIELVPDSSLRPNFFLVGTDDPAAEERLGAWDDADLDRDSEHMAVGKPAVVRRKPSAGERESAAPAAGEKRGGKGNTKREAAPESATNRAPASISPPRSVERPRARSAAVSVDTDTPPETPAAAPHARKRLIGQSQVVASEVEATPVMTVHTARTRKARADAARTDAARTDAARTREASADTSPRGPARGVAAPATPDGDRKIRARRATAGEVAHAPETLASRTARAKTKAAAAGGAISTGDRHGNPAVDLPTPAVAALARMPRRTPVNGPRKSTEHGSAAERQAATLDRAGGAVSVRGRRARSTQPAAASEAVKPGPTGRRRRGRGGAGTADIPAQLVLPLVPAEPPSATKRARGTKIGAPDGARSRDRQSGGATAPKRAREKVAPPSKATNVAPGRNAVAGSTQGGAPHASERRRDEPRRDEPRTRVAHGGGGRPVGATRHAGQAVAEAAPGTTVAPRVKARGERSATARAATAHATGSGMPRTANPRPAARRPTRAPTANAPSAHAPSAHAPTARPITEASSTATPGSRVSGARRGTRTRGETKTPSATWALAVPRRRRRAS